MTYTFYDETTSVEFVPNFETKGIIIIANWIDDPYSTISCNLDADDIDQLINALKYIKTTM